MADLDPVVVTTISNIRNTSIIRKITMKTSTAKDLEQDLVLDLPNHAGNQHTTLLDVDDLLQNSTAHPLKTQIQTVITQMNTNMDAELGNDPAVAGGNIFAELQDDLENENTGNIIPVKTRVHAKLNTAITASTAALNTYNNEKMEDAEELADTRASVKATTAVATAMDDYAKVISDAIDFGEAYSYQTGKVQNYTMGLDKYAPDLNEVVSSGGTRTMIALADTVYFNTYARVYFVSQNGKLSRLISSDNFVIRNGDYTVSELVSLYSASYFTTDNVDLAVASGSANRYTISTTSSNVVAGSYTAPTISPTATLTAISSLADATFKIYYSISKRVYFIKLNADSFMRQIVDADRNLLTGYQLETNMNSKDGVLLFSYIVSAGNYISTENVSLTAFNDLSEIRPGYKAELVTTSDTIVRNTTTGLYYVKVIKSDSDNTTSIATTPAQIQLIPLRTRYGQHFRDGVYGPASAKTDLLARDVFFFTEDFIGTSASISHVTVN